MNNTEIYIALNAKKFTHAAVPQDAFGISGLTQALIVLVHPGGSLAVKEFPRIGVDWCATNAASPSLQTH